MRCKKGQQMILDEVRSGASNDLFMKLQITRNQMRQEKSTLRRQIGPFMLFLLPPFGQFEIGPKVTKVNQNWQLEVDTWESVSNVRQCQSFIY